MRERNVSLLAPVRAVLHSLSLFTAGVGEADTARKERHGAGRLSHIVLEAKSRPHDPHPVRVRVIAASGEAADGSGEARRNNQMCGQRKEPAGHDHIDTFAFFAGADGRIQSTPHVQEAAGPTTETIRTAWGLVVIAFRPPHSLCPDLCSGPRRRGCARRCHGKLYEFGETRLLLSSLRRGSVWVRCWRVAHFSGRQDGRVHVNAKTGEQSGGQGAQRRKKGA